MITKLGFVGFILTGVCVLLLVKIVPLKDPLRSLLLSVAFVSLGILVLFKTDQVISPLFGSSRLNRWILKGLGVLMLFLGLAGLAGFAGVTFGLW
jgi:hypothetical protein